MAAQRDSDGMPLVCFSLLHSVVNPFYVFFSYV